MKSVMTHKFSEVPKAEIPRSSFDRSHGLKTTFDAGYLIPIYVDEALPGDTFNMNMTGFARLATPINPIMDNMFMDTQFFAVPIRLIWDNWQKFNGEQTDPGDSIDYTIPQLTGGTIAEGTISDYMGIPVGNDTGHNTTSALWHRAYNLIWNEWYRDQNLQDSVSNLSGDGPDNLSNYALLKRGKRHDYFTSCLPWPQKGDAVSIPIADTAPIVAKNEDIYAQNVSDTTDRAITFDTTNNIHGSSSPSATALMRWGTQTGLEADLTTAADVTINQLRQAFQIQKLLERDARGGTRYTEIIRSHFGVTSPDARVQRPEYLGGGSSPVNITPIPQTSSTDATTPQGNLAAYGTAGLTNHGFSKSFTEHCVVIGLCSVRADLTYQQGMERMFTRSTRYDFYWPALSHIGEQSVLSREIYIDNTASDWDVFGYQERYAEYRYKPAKLTGKMRSNVTGSLDTWHLSQDFATRPVLNATFIEEDPPVDRVVALPSEPHFIFDAYFSLRCARPMPLYGVPGNMDRF